MLFEYFFLTIISEFLATKDKIESGDSFNNLQGLIVEQFILNGLSTPTEMIEGV